MEIDLGSDYIGFQEAFRLICSKMPRLPSEEVSLDLCNNRIASADVFALVSYPPSDISLKDGFAVKSADVINASGESPALLDVIGSAFAGSSFGFAVAPGTSVKVCSGASIPNGADAVVSGEFCNEPEKGKVQIRADAARGRNILKAGAEVDSGAVVVRNGSVFLPGNIGLAAAAGVEKVSVYRRPRVAAIAVGDEIVAPGRHFRLGQIYPSNLIALQAWLGSFEIECATSVARDDAKAIVKELKKWRAEADVILTSGGAWGSERDLVIGTLAALGWQEAFHHVRMGPGKGVSFGKWGETPIFCLPGGPASNEMAFLQLALPGILRMSGDTRPPLPSVAARLEEDLKSRHPAWTEFKPGSLARNSEGAWTVSLYPTVSRLQAIAGANSLICIPEGTELLNRGQIVQVQMLNPRC
jgi:molybdopterin molybdotransferase